MFVAQPCLLDQSSLQRALLRFTLSAPLPSASFATFLPTISVSLSLPSPTPGRQLETVEGSPLVARLHRDEDPTRGGLVRQEEAVVNGRTPSEIIKQSPLHPEIVTFWGLGLQLG